MKDTAMRNLIQTSHFTVSRRTFCRSAIAALAGPVLVPHAVQAAAESNKPRFFKNLGCGHIGVRADQQQALTYAVRYGFDSITPSFGSFADKSDAQIRRWLATMKQKGVRYGSSGLPVNFRSDEQRFRDDLARLPERAAILQKLGVQRMATWILPGHSELTYLENFKRHADRLQKAAAILRDHDIRLGLEFVGPRTSRSRNRYPFISTQAEMMELVGAIDTGNVGLLLDSWHWYTSHGTVDELLALSGKDIIHVHVNDAPADIAVDQQIDNRRKLPVTTGVIDMKGFINALVRIGYDGPVECEPFDQQLREMDDEAAVEKTGDALRRVWSLIEA